MDKEIRGWMALEDEHYSASITINPETCGCILTDKQHKCGCEVYYNPEFDAIFCPQCNIWLEPRCTEGCHYYCEKRPRNPI